MPPDPVIANLQRHPVVRIEGADAPTLSAQLLSLVIEEDAAGLYQCKATFGNWGNAGGVPGYLHFDRQQLEFGKRLDVVVGATQVFEGRILALGAGFHTLSGPVIRVTADDRLQDLRMTRRTRTYENVSLNDVTRRLAEDHGLQAHVDVDAPTVLRLAQLDQSDLSFLREQCRLNGAEVWTEGAALHVVDRGRRDAGTMTLTYGRELLALDVSADLTSQCTRLTVAGWDVASKQAVNHEASDSNLRTDERHAETGASILARAFGARHVRAADVNAASPSEAQQRAESMFRASARRFVAARGVSDGSRALHVGTHVHLDGVGPLFSGEHYIASLRHRFDSVAGFRTEFTAERAWLGDPDS